MIDRLKWSLKRRARRWAGRLDALRSSLSGEAEPSAPVEPEPLDASAEVPLSPWAPSPDVEDAPGAEAAVAEPAAEPAPEGAMTMDSVQHVLDELIRPALQGDGGDCTLLKVEDDNVYLKLIGACNGCPSSTITLRMGIETVLKEEFPQMNELIQVDHAF